MVLNRKIGLAAGAAFLAVSVSGCAAFEPPKKNAPAIHINEDPYPSTYAPYPSVPTVIRGATAFDGDGGRIDNATVVMAGGVIQAVGGPETPVPARHAERPRPRRVAHAKRRHPAAPAAQPIEQAVAQVPAAAPTRVASSGPLSDILKGLGLAD